MDNQQERLFWWFVGFFDGEGFFTMNYRPAIRSIITACPVIGIANTNFDLIEKCHRVLDHHGIGHHVSNYKPRTEKNKPQKAVQVRGFKRASKFLEVFGDYVEKKEQAQVLRDFIAYRNKVNRYTPYGEYENSLLRKLKILNQKGILRDYTIDTINSEDIVRSHAKV